MPDQGARSPLAHAGGRVYGPGGADVLGFKPTTLAYRLTNDASLIVTTKKGNTNVTVQFSIQDEVGPEGIQYRTDSFKIDLGPSGFKGAGSTLHLHAPDIPISRLKGHTGGPKEEMVGTINIGDIVYN